MSMDIEKIMVLIKGEDKTESIINLDCGTEKINVTYSNGKQYKYNKNNVVILKNPKKVELNNRVICIDKIPVSNHRLILDFNYRIRIISKDGTYKTVKPEVVSYEKNECLSEIANDILKYLSEISSHISNDSLGESFLEGEIKSITLAKSESVLYTYLNKKTIKKRTQDIKDIIFPFSFNLSQKSALENSLEKSISVIEGPPGTGKTQTILNLLANIVAVKKKSVAVVSNNNEAVKNIIDKMNKNGYGFLTALLGKKDNQETFFNNLSTFKLDERWNCEENKETLINCIEELNIKLKELLSDDRRRAKLKQELQAWKLEQQHFNKYCDSKNIENIEYIDKLPILKYNLDKIISYIAESSIAIEREYDKKLIHKLKMFFKYGLSYFKFDKNEIKSLLLFESVFYEKQIQKLENELKDIENKLNSKSFNELLKQHQHKSEKLFRKLLYENYNNIPSFKYTKENFKKKFDKFIKTYPIILSTTYALKKSIDKDYLLDYVIIDEASQVDLITGVLVLSCCKNVIIVGDTKQLSPIIDSNIKCKLKTKVPSFEYNYFNNSILSSMLSLYNSDSLRVVLKEHYRCHPKIIEFCNKKYYNGELIPYTNYDLSETPLTLYRSCEGNHMRIVTHGNDKGRYNQRELDIIKKEVLDKENIKVDYSQIGVVTPYRKQADKANFILPNEIQSDTVHKYQGREKDVIIMSTVLDNSNMDINQSKFVDDPNMLNVAVSRAVKKFILVTDHDLFYQKGNNISDLIRYIQYNTLDKGIIDSQVISVFDLLYKEYSKKLKPLKAKMDKKAQYQSEEALRVLLEKILNKNEYKGYKYAQGILLYNLLNSFNLLNDEEKSYVENRASLDFVIYKDNDKSCKLVIEVDGFEFHENNPKQIKKDKLKDSILNKYKIPFIRLPTNKSGEEEKIIKALNQL